MKIAVVWKLIKDDLKVYSCGSMKSVNEMFILSTDTMYMFTLLCNLSWTLEQNGE